MCEGAEGFLARVLETLLASSSLSFLSGNVFERLAGLSSGPLDIDSRSLISRRNESTFSVGRAGRGGRLLALVEERETVDAISSSTSVVGLEP